MLSFQTIDPDTLELLKFLSVQPELRRTRLVGGTSLALQYGHRQSVDLDFFGRLPEDINNLIDAVRRAGNITIVNQSKIILQTTVNQVKVDFVDYSRYKWIDDPVVENELVLASDRDIAAMKINAIIGRGSRKDFIDLYVLLQHYSLSDILSFYQQKYPEYSEYRALLSMTYFDDAEMQDMPRMFIDTTWDDMKTAILQAVEAYQR